VVSLFYKSFFSIYNGESKILFYIGLAMVASGFILYFSTLPLLLKGIKETKLVTRGAYYLCRNPLYAAFLLLLLPGTALMLNSWLILTVPVIGYLLFIKNIRSECFEMEKFFGNDYKKYSSETPELFPFPFKKWFR
jgi:protein-S-isoprenylcysteine O-methyltransferase Ste14